MKRQQEGRGGRLNVHTESSSVRKRPDTKHRRICDRMRRERIHGKQKRKRFGRAVGRGSPAVGRCVAMSPRVLRAVASAVVVVVAVAVAVTVAAGVLAVASAPGRGVAGGRPRRGWRDGPRRGRARPAGWRQRQRSGRCVTGRGRRARRAPAPAGPGSGLRLSGRASVVRSATARWAGRDGGPLDPCVQVRARLGRCSRGRRQVGHADGEVGRLGRLEVVAVVVVVAAAGTRLVRRRVLARPAADERRHARAAEVGEAAEDGGGRRPLLHLARRRPRRRPTAAGRRAAAAPPRAPAAARGRPPRWPAAAAGSSPSPCGRCPCWAAAR